MMWQLRVQFPLHYVVFRQTSAHLPHEANVEQAFSRAGGVTDPNMDTGTLASMVSGNILTSSVLPADLYYATC